MAENIKDFFESHGIKADENYAKKLARTKFPDDPRGQELHAKYILDTISEAEKEELLKLPEKSTSDGLELKSSLSIGTDELLDKTKKGDPNVEQVSPFTGDGKAITVLPTDKKEKILWTFGLGGCNGTLIFAEDKNGKKNSILTHYGPDKIQENKRKLEDLIDANPEFKNNEIKKTILLLVRGDYYQDSKTMKWEMKPKDEIEKEILIETIKGKLGENVDVIIEPYSEAIEMNSKDWGTLIVRIPPNGKATYETWFGGKKNLEKKKEEKS